MLLESGWSIPVFWFLSILVSLSILGDYSKSTILLLTHFKSLFVAIYSEKNCFSSVFLQGTTTERKNRIIGKWVECSPMVRETWVQSSYQRLWKWYLIPPCLTLGNIRCVSRVKWRNPGKGVAPSPTPQCSSYWKGSLPVALDYSHQLTFAPSSHLHSVVLRRKAFFSGWIRY